MDATAETPNILNYQVLTTIKLTGDWGPNKGQLRSFKTRKTSGPVMDIRAEIAQILNHLNKLQIFETMVCIQG